MKRGKFEIKWKTRGAQSDTTTERYWWWVYVAPNGETVCQSQMLKSEQACRKGIAAVKRGFMNPVIVK